MVVSEIAVMAAIAMVVMADLAVIAIPVAGEVLVSVMMRLYPSCAGVGGARPVSVVPLIAAARGIPIASDPHISRAWASRLNTHYAHGRRGANSDSDRKLCKEGSPCQ